MKRFSVLVIVVFILGSIIANFNRLDWNPERIGKEVTEELNNDYVAKIVATGFEKDHDTYSYDKLISCVLSYLRTLSLKNVETL